MSRVIKFRAWDKVKKRFVKFGKTHEYGYGNYTMPELRIYGDATEIFFKEKFFYIDDRDLVWIQYTGLKDKNGKDVFEGDIISQQQCDFGGKDREIIGEVIWSRDCFALDNKDDQTLEVIMETASKVIGNIYENK